ncbi:hypothetical protein [Streptomyces sp. SBT349]|uniref:hypothetical protein n=1 Tax=Streptomyces sp. SBT349 TaxID=1580539 RepID=UPI00131E5CC9|nr:hypothetical protein [Streptomyces sp. SBT349]
MFIVEDLVTTGPCKRLTFTTGEHFTIRPHTVLWAARRINPRGPRRPDAQDHTRGHR